MAGPLALLRALPRRGLQRRDPAGGRRSHPVAGVDRRNAFQVHAAAKPPATGVRVDARSVHFNWLLLLPLLAGTRALGPGRLRARGATLAVLALVAVHVCFLAGIAEYRLLKSLGTHPEAAFGIFAFSQFYYSVGRVGLPILIWVPVGLRAVLLPDFTPPAARRSRRGPWSPAPPRGRSRGGSGDDRAGRHRAAAGARFGRGRFGPAAALLVAAVIAVYAGVLDAPYVLDDRTSILETRGEPIGALVQAEMTRALSNASFFVNRRVFGESLAAFHAGNVAIHATNAILLLALLRVIRRLRAPELPDWRPPREPCSGRSIRSRLARSPT